MRDRVFLGLVGFLIAFAIWLVQGWPVSTLWAPPLIGVFSAFFGEALRRA